MKIELEQKLFERYPTLFPKGRKVNPMESLMCFGFECRDGWFNLIDKLCSNILKCKNGDKIVVVQVKQKFGQLRFYAEGASREIYDLIYEVEGKSSKICEQCGKKGKLEEVKGWMTTLCARCKNEQH